MLWAAGLLEGLYEPTDPSPSESFTLDTEEGIETVRVSIPVYRESRVRLYDDWSQPCRHVDVLETGAV